MKIELRKIPSFVIVGVVFALLFLVGYFSVKFRIEAENIGGSIGSNLGTLTGKAIGSIEGVLVGSKEGWEAGKAKGLSAEDTTVKIIDTMKETARLEVLVASVKLKDIHSVGDDDYKALYMLKGNAIFSVDLSKADIDERTDGLYVTIPQPEMELIIDQSMIKKEAAYQKHYWKGSAEEGLDAYLNSMAQIAKKSESSLANYDSLVRAARNSATKQVIQLVNSVSASRKNVYVSFQDQEGKRQ